MDDITITEAERKKLKRMEEEKKVPGKEMTGEEKQKILKMLLLGVSVEEIAREIGRSHQTIRNLRCDCARTNALERPAPHAP